MKLFVNPMKDWENNMTETDLDKMEAQGCDVTAYREKLAARRAKEAEEEKQLREKWRNPTRLGRLDAFVPTPRDTETEFLKRTAGKAPWFGKSKWLKKFTEGSIIYVGVIDAPKELYTGARHADDIHQIIGVYALDDGHVRNAEWLMNLVGSLKRMCEGKAPMATGCERIKGIIADESDRKEFQLPANVADEAKAYVRRLVVEDKELPNGYLPSDSIVPHFYWDGTICCIDGSLYK